MPREKEQVQRFWEATIACAIIFIVVSCLLQHFFSVSDPLGTASGVVLSAANIFFLRRTFNSLISQQNDSRAALLLLFMKYPALIVIVALLCTQDRQFLYSALAGLLCFLPAGYFALREAPARPRADH